MLIDEAHRSHSSTLHMNLLSALPNCARIGFTGTPIIMGAKKKTTDIFGDYIDIYRLADAERDGAVVPILYSGRTVKGAVRDGRDLDEVFEDMFADHTEEELDEIQRRYATKGDVLAAEKLIQAKAKNILRHYVDTVLPSGLRPSSSPTTAAPWSATATPSSRPATTWSKRSKRSADKTLGRRP